MGTLIHQGSVRGKICSSCNGANRRRTTYCVHCSEAFPFAPFYRLVNITTALSVWLMIALLALLVVCIYQ